MLAQKAPALYRQRIYNRLYTQYGIFFSWGEGLWLHTISPKCVPNMEEQNRCIKVSFETDISSLRHFSTQSIGSRIGVCSIDIV